MHRHCFEFGILLIGICWGFGAWDLEFQPDTLFPITYLKVNGPGAWRWGGMLLPWKKHGKTRKKWGKFV